MFTGYGKAEKENSFDFKNYSKALSFKNYLRAPSFKEYTKNDIVFVSYMNRSSTKRAYIVTATTAR